MTYAEIQALSTFPNAMILADFPIRVLEMDENLVPITFESEEERVARYNFYFASELQNYKHLLLKQLFESKLQTHFQADGGVPWLSSLGANPAKVIGDKIFSREWESLNSDFAIYDASLESFLADRALASARQVILDQIDELEQQVTPRRLREALLSGDNSFISAIESQISVLRASL